MASKLGWILTGRVKCQESQFALSVLMLTYTSSPISTQLATQFNDQEPSTDCTPQLEDFWELETIGMCESVSVTVDDIQSPAEG